MSIRLLKPTDMLLAAALTLAACTSEGYDSGEGSYSGMRADFVEACTDGSAAIVSIVTDDGESLQLTQAVKAKWAEKGDTAYRALLYYKKVEASGGAVSAEAMGLRSVAVPQVAPAADFRDGVKTDPVTFNSAWISRSQKYLNLDLSLKTGRTDDEDAAQTLGVVLDSLGRNAQGGVTAALRLYHDQGTVPEYYSTACYVSVPLPRAPLGLVSGDSVRVSIATYGGEVTKTFVLK